MKGHGKTASRAHEHLRDTTGEDDRQRSKTSGLSTKPSATVARRSASEKRWKYLLVESADEGRIGNIEFYALATLGAVTVTLPPYLVL